MVGTISDWIIAAERAGLENLATFYTDKLEDDKRLINSGLPTFDRFITSYKTFLRQNKELMDFLLKYNLFLVRALPFENRTDLPRRPKKEFVTSFEECNEFFKQLFLTDKALKGNEDFYYASLVQLEPSIYSGIIISKPDMLLIELGARLDDLSHGENPSASYTIDFTKLGHIENKTYWDIGGNQRDQILTKRALRFITLNPDNFNPLFMRGYFEFVVTITDKIKFWDYKINEAYLK